MNRRCVITAGLAATLALWPHRLLAISDSQGDHAHQVGDLAIRRDTRDLILDYFRGRRLESDTDLKRWREMTRDLRPGQPLPRNIRFVALPARLQGKIVEHRKVAYRRLGDRVFLIDSRTSRILDILDLR